MTTLIMGIVNVTADSFSDGGRFLDPDAAIAHGLRLRAEGADLLDVGGESTRPGAQRIDQRLEQKRILPVVRELAAAGIAVSIDTMNAATALAAVRAGARIVNDVSGGLADPDLLAAVATTDADLVLGHWRGHSADMYAHAQYDDVASQVLTELAARVDAAQAAGIPPARLIADPGIGFGKKGEQNWVVLRALPRLTARGNRVLVGTSRKRFLAEAIAADDESGEPVDEARRDNSRLDRATAVTSVLAAQAGAWAVRVHDVAATRDALRVALRWEGKSRWTSSTRSP